MSGNLYLAPAATGKTEFSVKVALQAALVRRAGVHVVVPSELQAGAFRGRLAAAGGALGVHVHTFPDLATVCLNAADIPFVRLSGVVRQRLLRMLLDDIALDHYATIAGKPGFVQRVLRTIDTMKSALISPEAFKSAVQALGNDARLRELGALYEAYQKRLHDENWIDENGLYWLAIEAGQQLASVAQTPFHTFIVDGFDDLTEAQTALIRVIANLADDWMITLTAVKDTSDVFARQMLPRLDRTRERLEETLGITARALPRNLDTATSHRVLTDLAQGLIQSTSSSSLMVGEVVSLVACNDRHSEVRQALRWAKTQIEHLGTPLEAIAILARDLAPYRSHALQVAAEFGLPLRIAGGRPALESPLVAALVELCRVHLPAENGVAPAVPRRPVVETWRSPYFDWSALSEPILEEDVEYLDSLARAGQVISGREQWREAFRRAIASGTQEDGRLNAERVDHLQRSFRAFLEFTSPPRGARPMREYIDWLERLIGPDPAVIEGLPEDVPVSLNMVSRARENRGTADADLSALISLKEVLHGLGWASVAAAPGERLDYPRFFEELAGALAATMVSSTESSTTSAILLADVNQARGQHFEAVALLGLAEGEFPRPTTEDPFLRDADRIAIGHRVGREIPLATASVERTCFYESITRARERLLITRPLLTEDGAPWVASPFWESVLACTDVHPRHESADLVVEPSLAASWPELLQSIAISGDERGEVFAADNDAARWENVRRGQLILLQRGRHAASIFDGDLSALSADFSVQFGPDFVWSASSLEQYRACGFMFFMARVLDLGAKTEPAEGLNGRQLGTLFHRIFKAAYNDPDLPTDAPEGELSAHIEALARPLLGQAPERDGFRRNAWWEETQQAILEQVLRTVQKLDDEHFRPVGAEVHFDGEQFVLDQQDGDSLRLRGTIDRVDRAADGRLRIVDYKVGGLSAYTAASVRKGHKLQLPLYALAAERGLGLGAATEAFYWDIQRLQPSAFKLSKESEGSQAVFEAAVNFAWEAVHGARAGAFSPQSPDGGCPAYCPAAGFCLHYEARYQG